MDPLVKAALEARTRRDIERLEDMLRRALAGEHVRFLGDQEANWSSISSPADATSVLFERATNMFDAAIELEADRRRVLDCSSPADATHTFFGAPRGGVGEMSAGAREQLAMLSHILVLDSDDSVHRPTIAFRDRGIGIHTTDVPNTILSLQKSNKLRKAYTHGVFGKGGSTACAFSDATVIVTRKQPDLLGPGQEDRISVAVVGEGDAADVGLPFYRYLVGADGLPYSVPAAASPTFEPGTYVAHLNYLGGRMGLQNWNNEESIYAFAETILFDPTLPYLLEDARSGAANVRPETRQKPSVLSGLGQRLETLKPGDETTLGRSGWQTIPVPEVGEVRLRWWLFTDVDKRRRRAAKGFVVIFTTNGQIHHAWDQARLQQMVENRRRVGQRVFVQVDCDGIELKKRYKVFDSFRAQIRRGPEGRALEESVADALSHDPDLDEFEVDFTREALKATAQNISQAFRKRLNRALRSKVAGLSPRPGTGNEPKPPKPKLEIELYPEPTTMTGPAELTLLIGGRATAYMEINAIDGFVPDRGTISLEAAGAEQLPAIGVGDLRRGRLRLSLAALPPMKEGVLVIEVVLEWIRAAGGLGRITWPIQLNVVATIEPKPTPPTKPKGATGPSKDGDIAFLWVSGVAEGWTDETVGELQDIKGDLLAGKGEAYAELKGVETPIPTIVLNKDFADLAGYKRTIARRATDETLRGREERYGLAVGVTVANLALRERRLRQRYEVWEAKQNGTDEPTKPMSQEQMHRALAEAARGVLALMPDFDQLLGDLDE
jgi:hypothetical protein